MHDIRKIVAWMAGALLSFCGLAISIRELSAHAGVFDILAMRNLAGIILVGAYALRRERGALAWPRRPGLHVLRNLVHFAGQAAWSYGLTVLPLATVFALEFTTPAWVLLLATLFLREAVTPARIVALVLGFAGVLIILRPGAASFQPASLIVLGAAVGFASQITVTKFLTGSQSVTTILFWMNVMQLPMFMAAKAIQTGSPWLGTQLVAADLPALAALSVAGLSAHVCLTSAFRHGDATTVVPIDFLRIPAIAIVGAIFYRERFDLFVLLGAAVSAAGIIWSLRDTQRRAHG